MPKDSIDLGGYLDRARSDGVANLPVGEETFYLVRSKLKASTARSPIVGNDALIKPPLKRLAYSDRTAWLMAGLSELAYIRFEDGPEQESELETLLKAGNVHLLALFHDRDTDTQGFLAHRPGEFRVLAFRGTENLRDAKTDISALFKSTPYGKAHQGFLEAYQSVADKVEKALDASAAEGNDAQLLVTGHSLGGALATVATRMLEKAYTISGCYTFGSPRVGDERWADSFKTPVYRVINRADPVPLVPGSDVLRLLLTGLTRLPVLSWLAAPLTQFLERGYVGYQHVGDPRLLLGGHDDARLKIGSATVLSRVSSLLLDNILTPWALLYRIPKLVDDHRMPHYVAKLRKIAEDKNH